MATCEICGKKLWRASSRTCEACAEAERQNRASQAMAREVLASQTAAEKRPHLVLTTEVASGLEVAQRLGIVAGEVVLGLHMFKDLFAEVRDLVGGRSATLEKAIADARATALDRLSDAAARIGADAVVGVSITTSDIGRGGSMILIVATGTAVTLAHAPSA